MTGGELRVLVVDDEPLARDFLCRVLEGAPGVRVVGECADGEAAVAAIRDLSPDLVFLDIRMPEIDGFGVIERVGTDRMPEVIFVTAHEQFTLRAFEVHALDYVVKPCDPQRVLDALEHARGRIRAHGLGHLQERLEALVRAAHARSEPVPPPRRLTVREGERVRFVDVDDVEWLEADGSSVLVHVRAASHRVRVPLHALCDHLGPTRFLRIHRSAAVNVDRVAEVRPWGHGDYVALLDTGRELRVSRTYKDDLLRLVH
jgi:two-component system LytT family response regulator